MVTRMTEKTQEEISKRTYATVRAMARDILEFDLLSLSFKPKFCFLEFEL